MVKKRNFFSHFFEVIFYIAYTISVYYMSHLSIGEDIVIDNTYRLFSIVFIAATFGFFRNDNIEILKEMLKSGFILIFCQLIDKYLLGQSFDAEKLVYVIVAQIVWQSLSFVFAYIYRSNMKDHGRYVNILLAISISVLFLLIVVFELNIYASIIAFSVVFLFVGLCFYLKNEKEKQEIKERLEAEEKKKQEIERKEKQEKIEWQEKYKKLKSENEQFRKEKNLVKTKGKRKNRRLSKK